MTTPWMLLPSLAACTAALTAKSVCLSSLKERLDFVTWCCLVLFRR